MDAQLEEELGYEAQSLNHEAQREQMLSELQEGNKNLKTRINEFEDVCRNALTSLTITMLPRLDNNVASNNDIIKIVISSLEQALKG